MRIAATPTLACHCLPPSLQPAAAPARAHPLVSPPTLASYLLKLGDRLLNHVVRLIALAEVGQLQQGAAPLGQRLQTYEWAGEPWMSGTGDAGTALRRQPRL